jgi:hypothetical protein
MVTESLSNNSENCPYNAQLEKAYANARQLFDAQDFVYHNEAQNTKLYSKQIPGQTLPIIKGVAIFPSKYSPDDILLSIRNFDARKGWDERFESGEIVELFAPKCGLVHITQKGGLPIVRYVHNS